MKNLRTFFLHGFLALVLCVPRQLVAQELPFLSDQEIRMLSNELSGDRAFEHIRVLTRWHRDSGMEGFFKAADYVMSAAKEAGLEDVHFVEQTMDAPNYTAKSAELWMTEPVEVKLADLGDRAVYLADGSHSADVTAELIWIGDGSAASLQGLNVAGKIVLTSGSASSAARTAVWEKGAVGIVSYQTSENRNPMDEPDQIAWSRIPITPPEGKRGTFAFMLSPRKGEVLKNILETDKVKDFLSTGKKIKGGTVVLRAKVVTEIGPTPGRTGFVEAWIRGSTYHDQQIVLTAHLQEEQGSANDDGSGCANLLEIGRTFAALMKEGKIKRPLRDLRFWWTDEISSEYRYFPEHPTEPANFLVNLHEDMVGANLAMGSRVQHLIFAPFSRTSYLDALFEDVGNFLILTNNGYLAASRSGGYPRPFTRPLYATRGTRQGYNARFVPYFNSSDHMCFVDGAIGVPAVAAINWDDPYIHSSDDDLFQIDQTQLKRNAFLIGSMAYVLAYATGDAIPLFASETFAQGSRRLANDLQQAFRLLREQRSAPTGSDGGWSDATILINEGIAREVRAVHSAIAFAGRTATGKGSGSSSSMSTITQLEIRVLAERDELLGDCAALYTSLHGNPPAPHQSDSLELYARSKVPSYVQPLKAYFRNREKIDNRGNLHGLMAEEVLNFVDGKRSYYEIFTAVRAEQLAGGSWYYGTVTLGDVVGMLDAALRVEALTVHSP